MNAHQRAYIWVAMNKVVFYRQHGVSLWNSTDIKRVQKVREELGMSTKLCESCLDDVERFMSETYEEYIK